MDFRQFPRKSQYHGRRKMAVTSKQQATVWCAFRSVEPSKDPFYTMIAFGERINNRGLNMSYMQLVKLIASPEFTGIQPQNSTG